MDGCFTSLCYSQINAQHIFRIYAHVLQRSMVQHLTEVKLENTLVRQKRGYQINMKRFIIRSVSWQLWQLESAITDLGNLMAEFKEEYFKE